MNKKMWVYVINFSVYWAHSKRTSLHMGFLCLQLFELVYCLFLPSANIKVPIPIVELVLVYTIPYIILSSVSSVLYNLLNYYLHLKYENVTRFQENISLSYLLAARIKISYFAPVPFFIYDIVSVLFTFYYLLSFFRWFFNNLQTKGFVVRRCKCLKKNHLFRSYRRALCMVC